MSPGRPANRLRCVPRPALPRRLYIYLGASSRHRQSRFCRYTEVTVLSAVGKAPPQHLVRSTGTAMSTTGSHGVRAAQRPPSQFACTLAPVGNSHPRQRNRANVSLQDKLRRLLAPLTNGTVRPNAKCCAVLCKASSPTRHAPCQSLIAWQSPGPNPSDPKPSLPATKSRQRPHTSGCGPACRRIAKSAHFDRLLLTDIALASALCAHQLTAIGQSGLGPQPVLT